MTTKNIKDTVTIEVTRTNPNQTVYGFSTDFDYFYVPTHVLNVHDGDEYIFGGYNGIMYSSAYKFYINCALER